MMFYVLINDRTKQRRTLLSIKKVMIIAFGVLISRKRIEEI